MLDSPGLRVAFDIGGTFTDVIIASETQISRFKILTLPASVGADVHECIEGVVRANPGISVESLVHGTTVAANTVLELSGAKTGLITTAGSGSSSVASEVSHPAPRSAAYSQLIRTD